MSLTQEAVEQDTAVFVRAAVEIQDVCNVQ